MEPVGVGERGAVQRAGADGRRDAPEHERQQIGQAESDAGRRLDLGVLEPVEHREPREQARAEQTPGELVRG